MTMALTSRRRTTLATLALAALLLAFAVGGFGGAGTGTAGAVGCSNAKASVGSLSNGQIRQAIRCLLNQERVRTNRPVVKTNRKLQRAANFHTREMLQMRAMTHNSQNGESAVYRIHNRFGYGLGASSWGVGEILGQCYGQGCTANKIVRLWLRSSVHSKIIHRRRWMHFGVGARHGWTGAPDRNSAAIVTVDWGYRH